MNRATPRLLKALKAGKLEDAVTKAIREVAKDVVGDLRVSN